MRLPVNCDGLHTICSTNLNGDLAFAMVVGRHIPGRDESLHQEGGEDNHDHMLFKHTAYAEKKSSLTEQKNGRICVTMQAKSDGKQPNVTIFYVSKRYIDVMWWSV